MFHIEALVWTVRVVPNTQSSGPVPVQAMSDDAEQKCSDAFALPFSQNVDVLELSITSESPRVVVGDISNGLAATLGNEDPAIAEDSQRHCAPQEIVTPATRPELHVAIVVVDPIGERCFLGGDEDPDNCIRIVRRGTTDF